LFLADSDVSEELKPSLDADYPLLEYVQISSFDTKVLIRNSFRRLTLTSRLTNLETWG
jgi:hypothetical protein